MDRSVTLTSVLGLHLVAATTHGSAHTLVPVRLSPTLNGLILLTVFLGPFVGVVLYLRGHPLGIPVFTVSIAGALVIGGVLHFLIENADHVAAVPASQWRWLFQVSAVGVFGTPALGVTVGAWLWVDRF